MRLTDPTDRTLHLTVAFCLVSPAPLALCCIGSGQQAGPHAHVFLFLFFLSIIIVIIFLVVFRFSCSRFPCCVQSRNAFPAKEILNLTDYRQRYNQYNSDVDTKAMRASAPLIPVWYNNGVF